MSWVRAKPCACIWPSSLCLLLVVRDHSLLITWPTAISAQVLHCNPRSEEEDAAWTLPGSISKHPLASCVLLEDGAELSLDGSRAGYSRSPLTSRDLLHHMTEGLSLIAFLPLEMHVFIFRGSQRKRLVSRCDEESVEQRLVLGTIGEAGGGQGEGNEGSYTNKVNHRQKATDTGTGHRPQCPRLLERNSTYPER